MRHVGPALPGNPFNRSDSEDRSVRMGWIGDDLLFLAVHEEIGGFQDGLTDQHFVASAHAKLMQYFWRYYRSSRPRVDECFNLTTAHGLLVNEPLCGLLQICGVREPNSHMNLTHLFSLRVGHKGNFIITPFNPLEIWTRPRRSSAVFVMLPLPVPTTGAQNRAESYFHSQS